MIEGYPTAPEAKAIVEQILLNKALYPAEVVVYLFTRVRRKIRENYGDLIKVEIRVLSAWVKRKFPIEFMIVNQAIEELADDGKLEGMIEDGRIRVKRQ